MNRTPIGIVAGSGLELEAILDAVDQVVPFEQLPGLAPSGVPGHPGRFLIGWSGGVSVVLQSGRLHIYEGLSYHDVVRPVEVLAEMGARRIIFTNAAGGLRPEMVPGDLVAVQELRLWPCRRWPGYPSRLNADFTISGCAYEGRYAWVHGPCYETRSEVMALQALGADLVGMSTAPELAHCKALGLKAAVVACVTNNCCVRQRLTHDHVIQTAQTASGKLRALLINFLKHCTHKNRPC